MREIMFRGKSVDNGEWVYGYYRKEKIGMSCDPFSDFRVFIISQGNINVSPQEIEVTPETVGQYLGVTKKGEDVYEGDALGVNLYGGWEIAGVLRWDKEEWCFYLSTGDKFYSDEELEDSLEFEGTEILGNIHDNPEILKYWDYLWKRGTHKMKYRNKKE